MSQRASDFLWGAVVGALVFALGQLASASDSAWRCLLNAQ